MQDDVNDQTTISSPVTELVEQIVADGNDKAASAELLPLVYDELRKLARSRLARERNPDSQPTSLVHEVYLRLVGDGDYRWNSRAHFFGAAAEAMKRIVIEQARSSSRLKRGGDLVRASLPDHLVGSEPPSAELLALSESLDRLEQIDADMTTVVKLRYFAGMTVQETARALDRSPRSIDRTWAAARAWLTAELDDG